MDMPSRLTSSLSAFIIMNLLLPLHVAAHAESANKQHENFTNFELHKQSEGPSARQEKHKRKKTKRQERKERKRLKRRQEKYADIALSMNIDVVTIPQTDSEWTQFVMNKVFDDLNGFRVTAEEQDSVVARGGFPTYGEITYDSLQILLDELQLTEKDVFVDLGSGIGRVVTQVYLNSPVKKSCGVELCETRYFNALEAKERLKEFDLLDNRQLAYYNENMLDVDFKDATVFYTCATCFSHELMLALTKKLSKLKKGLRVLTLKELPAYDLYGFKFVKEFNLPMTWSPDGSPVYMYELVA